MDINILLFEDFQTLDVFGPAEVLARIDGAHLRFFSRSGGIITSAQGVPVVTEPAAAADMSEILVVPGGRGTRTLAEDDDFLRFLRDWADRARFCLSVCTGSALLARCGVLDAVREGEIDSRRHGRYAELLNELKIKWRERYD